MLSPQLDHPGWTSLEIYLPSARDSVNTACETVQEFLRPFGASRSPNIEVVLRELLMNAVIHGNGEDKTLPVRCRVTRRSDGRVRIEVEDQGRGFPHADLCPGSSTIDHPKDRHGYDLICALSDRLEFNAAGNKITAQLSLKT